MATVQRYVNTASSAGGDGTTNNTSGSTRAYATLSEWEANSGGSGTDDYIVDCSGSSADTTATDVSFAVPVTTGTVLIRGNRSSGSGFNTSGVVIDTNMYRMSQSGSVSTLTLTENKVTVDGIQVECGANGGYAAILLSGVGSHTVRKTHCRATGSVTQYGIGTAGQYLGGSGVTTIENNLIVGFSAVGVGFGVSTFYGPTVTLNQNTIYGQNPSIGVQYLEQAANTGTCAIKGNAIGNSGASNCLSVTVNGGTVTYNFNATEDAQGTTNETAIGTLSNAWTSPGLTQGSNFAVKDNGSSLYNILTPALASTDATDFSRGSAPNDIGAFEMQSSNTNIAPSVGSIVLTGSAPTVDRTQSVSPSVGSIALTGSAPSVSYSFNLLPSAGSLALTGPAPTISRQASDTPITLTSGTLALTGSAPSLGFGIVIGTSQESYNVGGVIYLTGGSPVIINQSYNSNFSSNKASRMSISGLSIGL